MEGVWRDKVRLLGGFIGRGRTGAGYKDWLCPERVVQSEDKKGSWLKAIEVEKFSYSFY